MDKLDEVALFNIAIKLNVPQLLNLCRSSKRFNDKICNRDPIWLYLLNKEFPKEKDQFGSLNSSIDCTKSKDLSIGPKDLFKLLYSLKMLKEKLNLKDSLLGLYNREVLNFSYGRLKEIPREIGNLTNLQQLYLYSNQIEKIPKEIGNLTKLVALSLSQNQLKEISKEICSLTNLRELFLYNNQIEEIPKELGNLTNLETLSLYNNKWKEIPKEIQNNCKKIKMIV